MTSEVSKKRSRNFIFEEEELLLELVKKYKDIIECKKTDAVTWKMKKKAWEDLTEEYNMLNGKVRRDSSTLKGKYENLKKNSKKKFSNEKIKMCGTGGGPAEIVSTTATDTIIHEIIGVAMTGEVSEFDCDANNANCIVQDVIIEETQENIKEDHSSDVNKYMYFTSTLEPVYNEDNSQDVKNIENENPGMTVKKFEFTPAYLKTPKSKQLSIKKEKLQNKQQDHAQKRLQYYTVQEISLKEESDLRKELMKQEYKMKIQLLQEESTLRKVLMKEESDLEKSLKKQQYGFN